MSNLLMGGTPAPGSFATDPSKLGKDFKSWSFNGSWDGSGADSISAGIASRVMGDPELMKRLGLTEADIRQTRAEGYNHDSFVDAQYEISDAARKALTGLTMSRTGVAGMKDGRSQVLRDAQGNILSTGKAYSYDPAGDLKDAALKGLGVVGAGWAAGNLLGLAGGSAAPAAAAGAEAAATAAGAEGASALSGLDLAAAQSGAGLSGGAGGAVVGAEAAGAAGAVAGDSAVKAALFGGSGYGAGMTGAATSAFDSVLAMTGSKGLAAAAGTAVNALGSGGSWLADSIGKITGGDSLLGGLFKGSSVMRDVLGLVGAGMEQFNIERMAEKNRQWQSAEREKDRQFELKKDADRRRRQAPVANILGSVVVKKGTDGIAG